MQRIKQLVGDYWDIVVTIAILVSAVILAATVIILFIVFSYIALQEKLGLPELNSVAIFIITFVSFISVLTLALLKIRSIKRR